MHTPMAQATRGLRLSRVLGAMSWRVERRIVAPCRRSPPAVSPPSPMPCALRVVSRAHSPVSLAVSRAISRPKKVAPSHDTKFVSRLTPSCQVAHAPLAPHVGQQCRKSCRARGWPYRSPAAPPSTHPLGCIMAWCPCCVTIQYVVS